MYASGLAAVNACLVFLKSKPLAIGDGYYGSRQLVELYQPLTGCQIIGLGDLDVLQEGDVINFETPVKPTREASSIKYFPTRLNRGAYLVVYSTFCSPGLPPISKSPSPRPRHRYRHA
jgi:cystathionine beta-lyase/cystathionine gamma-synthase